MNIDQGMREDISQDEVPEIHRAEMRLAEAIGSLDIGLSELQKRLERVLRPEESIPEDPMKIMEVRPATTPTTDFLSAQASRVESEVVRVNDLLRRLGL